MQYRVNAILTYVHTYVRIWLNSVIRVVVEMLWESQPAATLGHTLSALAESIPSQMDVFSHSR